ncbi:putative bifunctional diguanylate cyclase/phosphodiesterase [Vibrio sp. WJH972]
MMNLRKHFGLIFILVSLTTSVAFLFYSVEEWQQVKEESAKYQHSHLTLFTDSTSAFFSQISSSFDLLGEHLISIELTEDDFHYPLIDKLVQQHSWIKALSVMTMDGTFIAASSNFTPHHPDRNKDDPLQLFRQSKLPNGTIMKRSHVSLVEGATESVIPFGRYVGRIKDSNTPLLAVTSGIVFENMPLFFEKIGNEAYHSYEIIREDQYLQFSIRSIYSDLSKKVPESYFNQISSHNSFNRHQTEITTVTKDGKSYQAVIFFMPELRLWFVSTIPTSQLVATYAKKQLPLTFGIIGLLIIFYGLTRYINRIEARNEDTLLHQLEHDHITYLPNRVYLKNNLNDWLATHKVATLYYIDVDKFKDINEGFGYSVGDTLLIKIAQRLMSEAGKDALVVREYANRFLLITPDIGEHSPVSYGDSLQAILTEPYLLESSHISITASVGIVSYPEHGEDYHDLMMSADIALSDAKKSRNSVTSLSSSILARYQSRVQIGKLLRGAIEENLPFMVFQPQINRHGQVQSLESLARWKDEQFGMIAPDKFIHVAEVTGQMNDLGFLIIDKSFRDFSYIQEHVSSPLSLSLNVSIQQLSDKRFLRFIVDGMTKYGISGSSIIVEVTESIFIDDNQHIRPVCKQLEFYGIRLSLDDFGTGYSSLSVLKKLEISELKIDRSFVMTMTNEQKSLSLVQTILKLAKQLNMKSVAEGVETKEQYEILKQCDCDLFQGYYFAKPMNADETIHFINSFNDQS